MKAIIFAAGLGTRLQPLTNSKPKAMVELNGKPLLFHAIHRLKKAGISEIIVNVHHFSEQIISYAFNTDFGIPIHISDESDELLDTGGGIKKAAHLLQDEAPFLAYNVDVISSVNIKKVVALHKTQNALVTLVVRKRETSRYFMFDKKMNLTGWKNFSTGDEKISHFNFDHSRPYAFSGIHVISQDIFPLIKEEGKFSVVPLYLELAKKHPLIGYEDTSDFWIDLGKPGQISLAEEWLEKTEGNI